MKTFAFAILALLVLSACRAGWDDAPPPPPGQVCRSTEVACPTQHGCCDEGSTCGGEPASVGCPADSCCPVLGSPAANFRAPDAGATFRPMRHP